MQHDRQEVLETLDEYVAVIDGFEGSVGQIVFQVTAKRKGQAVEGQHFFFEQA